MRSRNNAVFFLLITSIILVIMSAVITYLNSQEKKESARWIIHTYQVIQNSTHLLSLIKDLETGQRGYLITQDSSFLEPYHNAKTEITSSEDSLQNLVQYDDSTGMLLEKRIRQIIDNRVQALEHAIAILHTFGKDSVTAFVGSKEGQAQMDTLRKLVSELVLHERILLTKRNEHYALKSDQEDSVRFISFTLIGLTSLLAFISLLKKNRQVEKLLANLREANELLEDKVEQRTKELNAEKEQTTDLNEQLKLNIEELSAVHEALQIRNSKTEEALNEINDLYNNAPCGYHSLNGEGVFIRMNSTELRWLGYEREEIIGKKKLTDIITPACIASFHENFAKLKTQGAIYNAEFEFVRKDGSVFPVMLNSTAVYDKGLYYMNRTTIFDISERKKLEQKLIALNKEKDHFMGIASHDLKAPIAGIFGLIRLMKTDTHNRHATDLEYFTYIEDSCKNMQHLINNLLDINRIESGLITLNKQETDLYTMLNHIEKEFTEPAIRKSIHLTIDKIEGVILTDPDALKSIIDNLVSNAIKFSPPYKKVEVQIKLTDSQIKFEIIDQGPGIPPDEIPLMFGKFQRLSNKPTGGEGSTGLGLSIVKELTTLLRGTLHITSRIGEGTRVTLVIPLQPELNTNDEAQNLKSNN